MSTSSTSSKIIIDDTRSAFEAYTGSWEGSKADQWFNGTASSTNGTVKMTFNGTSVSFIGSTPPSSFPQTFMVSVDGKTPANTSFSDPNPPSYRQWYQSPTLSDGLHTITLSNLSSSSIDFALVTVGQETPIGGERIVVDDDDPAIQYNGNWRRNRAKFNLGGSVSISGFTLASSTHETDAVGSSFSYRFSGTAIAIYGVFDFSPSNLVLSFSIDSQPLTQSYRVTTSSPQFVSERGQQPNYPFYSFDFLTSGEHTLVVNVSECVNETFRFDYLTYVPTFTKLSGMPPGVGGSDAGSANSSTSMDKGSVSPATIAISAVFTVLGSALLGFLLFWFLRRRAKRKQIASQDTVLPPRRTVDGTHTPLLASFDPEQPRPPSPARNPAGWTPTPTPYTLLPTNTVTNMNQGSSLGPMAVMQDASAVHYGLNFPHVADSDNYKGPSSGSLQTRTHGNHPAGTDIEPPSYEFAISPR